MFLVLGPHRESHTHTHTRAHTHTHSLTLASALPPSQWGASVARFFITHGNFDSGYWVECQQSKRLGIPWLAQPDTGKSRETEEESREGDGGELNGTGRGQ